MKGVMRPMFERIVREMYDGAKDFDMRVLLSVACFCRVYRAFRVVRRLQVDCRAQSRR